MIRQRESEIVDREREALKMHLAKIEEEEMKVQLAKRNKAKTMLAEVEHANKLALAIKEERKLKEKEQDEAIFRHI